LYGLPGVDRLVSAISISAAIAVRRCLRAARVSTRTIGAFAGARSASGRRWGPPCRSGAGRPCLGSVTSGNCRGGPRT